MRFGLALLLTVWVGTASAQEATTIHFGAGVEIVGQGATFDLGVLQITAPGRYAFSGELGEGAVLVDAPGAVVELVLNGVSVTNSTGPAILVLEAEAVRVMLSSGTENTLKDGGSSDFNAVIYSRASLEVAGSGSLRIEAADEGITSEMHMEIADGELFIHAHEDGINANNDNVSVITVSGGSLTIVSDTGDAIDSNGTIEITGGATWAWGFAEDAESGLDADNGVTIDGGVIVATGSRNGARMTEIGGGQPVVAHTFDDTQPAGGEFVLSKDGSLLLRFAPPARFENVMMSLPALERGETYTLSADGVSALTLTAGEVAREIVLVH